MRYAAFVSIRPASRALILLLASVMPCVACSSGGSSAKPTVSASVVAVSASPTKPAGKPSGGAGSLIISMPAGLVEYSIKNGTQKPLIKPDTDNTFLLDPAISPDGKRLVYIVQPPPKIDAGKYDAGSDLWIANRDGSNPHPVFTHEQSNQLIRFPQWQDNDTILVVMQEIAPKNGVTTVSYVLNRLPAAGGARTRVLTDVLAFGLSPDGRRLAYARLAPQTGESLESVGIDGANPAPLIAASENLAPFNVPRYSPDGTKVAFASADQTGARVASPEYVSVAGVGVSPAPPLDGLPEDIWTVDAAGGRPVRVADLKEDLPALTWSGDGKHLYVIGSAGLYDVNVGTGAVDRLGEGAFHAQLVWVP